ncbi:MAG: mucoidy inhibitor MuiA family protein [Pseudomonadota bacterium]|nr:mucoidy inhibitor MuiA family protein [Pseudomonadota bacterium]
MIKFIYALLISLIIPSVLFAGGEIVVSPSLTTVKVFLKGAELSHAAKVKLEKGMNEVVFTGLASKIVANSINISGKGDAVIMSVVQRLDYLRPPEKNQQIKTLEDSLETLNKIFSQNQNEIDVLKAETDLLMANKSIGGSEKGVSVQELQKMAEYYSKRFAEIKSRMLELSLNAKKIQKDIERVKNQLNEENRQINKTTNEVVIAVLSKAGGTAELNLSYLINDSGWLPSYDIRVDRVNSPANLSSKADVWQQSGLNWKEVEIILSTRNPSLNNNQPEISPWFIDFYRPPVYREMKAIAEKSAPMASFEAYGAKQDAGTEEAKTMADYFDINSKQLSVEFKPQIKYSIPSDGKPHYVALQEFSVPADYEYYTAPKLDNNAFLLARLTDWAGYNLLAGQSNIYFENSYIGQSYLNPATSEETLIISLGRDQNITVSRESLKDFTEDKLLSSDVERTFAFEIKVKNNKKAAVKVSIEDQVPISKNKDIVVKLIESSGAVYDSESGKLKWLVDVEAGKAVIKKLAYSVRHPKGKTIQGL